MPEVKEVHFFDLKYNNGFEWYTSVFPNVKGKITGEATPYYLFHPAVPGRVKKDLPNIKLIVLLRNPVDRAYSHFIHSKKEKVETEKSFEYVLQLESERLKDAENRLATGEIQRHISHQHHSYLTRGFYSEQIARWLKYFPKDQFLFIQSEDFFSAPQEHLNSVFHFLKLNPIICKEFKIYNEGEYLQTLSKEKYNTLIKQYVEDIKKTEQLTGLKLSWCI